MPAAETWDGRGVFIAFGGETLIVYSQGEHGMQCGIHLVPGEAIKLAEQILQGCDERDWT